MGTKGCAWMLNGVVELHTYMLSLKSRYDLGLINVKESERGNLRKERLCREIAAHVDHKEIPNYGKFGQALGRKRTSSGNLTPSNLESDEDCELTNSKTESRVVETTPEVVVAPLVEGGDDSKLLNGGALPTPEMTLNNILENEKNGDGNYGIGGITVNETLHNGRVTSMMDNRVKSARVDETRTDVDWVESVGEEVNRVNNEPGMGKGLSFFGPGINEGSIERRKEVGVCDQLDVDGNPNAEIDSSKTVSDEWVEAVKAKEICGKGGIFFKNRDEGTLLSRLMGSKLRKQNKGESKRQRTKQSMIPTGIKGRNLSTRILMSCSKSKLR
ncbi:hypothetical protein PIB30_087570 [Stylosanthes scabra]|uniref:Uncharacterized protein n=1 Tax=Stylosanthes scabra TaxID=79078 RepID=A0ABU6XSF4_9FABA|nr:hypothetical protein [Stylosanthes scabra]